MAALDEKLMARVDALIEKGKATLRTHTPNPPGVFGFPTINDTAFAEWKSQSEALIVGLVGPEHPYTKNFQGRVEKPYCSETEAGIGILQAIREDLAGGFLTDLRTLLSAEVFTDFLEMAAHLIEAGYKDPAASLIGAVLEDGLRRIGAARNIASIKSGDQLGTLNDKCAAAGIYNRIVQSQVAAWKKIRDAADHGHFSEYSRDQVLDLHRGVTAFLAEHLK